MFKNGDIIEVRITKILKTHIIVKTISSTMYAGILHISQISDYLVQDINKFFKIKQKVYLKTSSIDVNKRFINFSYKIIRPKLLKNPNKFEIVETQKGFDNLYSATMKVVDND